MKKKNENPTDEKNERPTGHKKDMNFYAPLNS